MHRAPDSLAAYASTDSLDFSEPIRVRVYNMSGTAYRQYTVSVNIHRQTGYEMTWASTSYSALGLVGNRRMAYNNGQLYLFGEQGGQTVGYKLAGNSWQQLSSSMQLAADAYRSLIAKDGYLYVLSNGSVLRSADGQTWSQTAQGTTLTQLLGASDAALYALSADGIASSKDKGATWTAATPSTTRPPTCPRRMSTLCASPRRPTSSPTTSWWWHARWCHPRVAQGGGECRQRAGTALGLLSRRRVQQETASGTGQPAGGRLRQWLLALGGDFRPSITVLTRGSPGRPTTAISCPRPSAARPRPSP
jgi:hypothetical protein